MAAVQPRFSSHRQQSGLFHDACRAGAAPMEPHRETVAPPPQEQQLPPLFLHFPHGDGDGGRRHRRPATTGLRLGFNDGGSDHAHAARTSASFLPDGVATLFDDRYRNEMDMMIQEHAERLRRALADTRRRHSRSLLGAAEEFAARRVREKEADASKAARRGAELEERLARLRAEAAAWQAKAMSDQSTAAALHAQLQQAAAQARSGKAAEEDDDVAGAAEDAASGFVDPDRVVEVVAPPPVARPCRACRLSPASTVLLPCRHLCVCDACETAVSASAACPMCRCPVTGTVQVVFS